MLEHKYVLLKLHEFLTFFGAKNRAADVAADTPLTCRRRTADVAADVAADVVPSERPEIVFSAPIHRLHTRKISPRRKRPGDF